MLDLHQKCKVEIKARDDRLERLRKIIERQAGELNDLSTELAHLKKEKTDGKK